MHAAANNHYDQMHTAIPGARSPLAGLVRVMVGPVLGRTTAALLQAPGLMSCCCAPAQRAMQPLLYVLPLAHTGMYSMVQMQPGQERSRSHNQVQGQQEAVSRDETMPHLASAPLRCKQR